MGGYFPSVIRFVSFRLRFIRKRGKALKKGNYRGIDLRLTEGGHSCPPRLAGWKTRPPFATVPQSHLKIDT